MRPFIARTNKDPTNFREAMASNEKYGWQRAVYEEFKSMNENKVCEIVGRPKTDKLGNKINLIDSRWLFKRKIGSEGKEIFKARLVIRGFKDKNDYELIDTYAPISKLSIVRLVLAVINESELEVCQIDVKTAVLNSKSEEEIYMTIPEGLDCNEKDRREKVCLLKKSIYGLKISSKRWFQCFTQEVLKSGLERDFNQP